MARLNITGRTLTERLESLIGIVGRMQQLQVGKGFLAAPAILPLSCMVKTPLTEEVLIEYFFPVSGSITKVVSNMIGARKATIDIILVNDGNQMQRTISFGDGLREEQLAIDVKAGAFITVMLRSRDPVNSQIDYLGVGIVFDVSVEKERMKKLAYKDLGLEE